MNTKPDELQRAERAVEESRAELARSLRQVGKSSENLMNRVQSELKPTVMIAAAVVGAIAVTGVVVSFARRDRPRTWLAPHRPSALGVAAKAVGLWALRFAARRLAQEVVARLDNAQPTAAAGAAPAAAQ